MDYKVEFYEEDASIVVVNLYDDDWANFDKAFDDAFVMVTENPKERYDIIMMISKIHSKGRPLQHFKRLGEHLRKHSEVIGMVIVSSNSSFLFAFFDIIADVVIRVALNRKVPTTYAKTIEEAQGFIGKWRANN